MSEKEKTVNSVQLRKSFKYRAVSLMLCYIGMCSSLLALEPYKEIGNPGDPLNLQPYVVAGRYTVFDFASQYCPPCRAATIQFKALAHKYPNHYAFRRIDINRPGVVGIDWTSPLARQYALQSIPHLVIYGPDKRLIAEGDTAEKWMADDLRRLQQE
jgi:thiol-disulfide isomerase/thioredoxin